jgi:hypothetical protein
LQNQTDDIALGTLIAVPDPSSPESRFDPANSLPAMTWQWKCIQCQVSTHTCKETPNLTQSIEKRWVEK